MAQGKTFFDFASIEENDNGVSYLTPSLVPELPISPLAETRIDETEQYRPDKIAYRLYGDPTLNWIIDQANGFLGKEKFSGYVAGKIIQYPRVSTLRIMGILI